MANNNNIENELVKYIANEVAVEFANNRINDTEEEIEKFAIKSGLEFFIRKSGYGDISADKLAEIADIIHSAKTTGKYDQLLNFTYDMIQKNDKKTILFSKAGEGVDRKLVTQVLKKAKFIKEGSFSETESIPVISITEDTVSSYHNENGEFKFLSVLPFMTITHGGIITNGIGRRLSVLPWYFVETDYISEEEFKARKKGYYNFTYQYDRFFLHFHCRKTDILMLSTPYSTSRFVVSYII